MTTTRLSRKALESGLLQSAGLNVRSDEPDVNRRLAAMEDVGLL